MLTSYQANADTYQEMEKLFRPGTKLPDPLPSNVFSSPNNPEWGLRGDQEVVIERNIAPPHTRTIQVKPDTVYQPNIDLWVVLSKRNGYSAYQVRRMPIKRIASPPPEMRWACSCPDFKERRVETDYPYCKHIALVFNECMEGPDPKNKWVIYRHFAAAFTAIVNFYLLDRESRSIEDPTNNELIDFIFKMPFLTIDVLTLLEKRYMFPAEKQTKEFFDRLKTLVSEHKDEVDFICGRAAHT